MSITTIVSDIVLAGAAGASVCLTNMNVGREVVDSRAVVSGTALSVALSLIPNDGTKLICRGFNTGIIIGFGLYNICHAYHKYMDSRLANQSVSNLATPRTMDIIPIAPIGGETADPLEAASAPMGPVDYTERINTIDYPGDEVTSEHFLVYDVDELGLDTLRSILGHDLPQKNIEEIYTKLDDQYYRIYIHNNEYPLALIRGRRLYPGDDYDKCDIMTYDVKGVWTK